MKAARRAKSAKSLLRSGSRLALAAGSVLAVGAGLAITSVTGANAATATAAICGQYCDGAPISDATADRLADGTTIFGRSIELHISDKQALAWAIISNGDPTDEVWLDRSFDGGATIADTKLGDTTIPTGARSTNTNLYNLNNADQHGVVRACGKAGNRPDIVCTAWTTTAAAPKPTSPAGGAVDALVKLYDSSSGLFKTTGWWNSANDLTGIIDYSAATGDHQYDWIIANTYEKNVNAQGGQFTNDFIDDTGWWALAWIRAYDLTHDPRYLQTAEHDAAYMASYSDNTCGGGVWWNTSKNYKNAVTNELFIKVTAELATRATDGASYLTQSVNTWKWLQASGMINSQNLINDGLDFTTCKNNAGTTWSYNQGVILGGLNDLYLATGQDSYLTEATTLANASTSSTFLNPNGVLTEPCEAAGCGGDGPTFKGVYVRNLGELDATLHAHPYQPYLIRQGTSAWQHDRNAYNQYGVHWAGPIADISAATQGSALDAEVAALPAHQG